MKSLVVALLLALTVSLFGAAVWQVAGDIGPGDRAIAGDIGPGD